MRLPKTSLVLGIFAILESVACSTDKTDSAAALDAGRVGLTSTSGGQPSGGATSTSTANGGTTAADDAAASSDAGE